MDTYTYGSYPLCPRTSCDCSGDGKSQKRAVSRLFCVNCSHACVTSVSFSFIIVIAVLSIFFRFSQNHPCLIKPVTNRDANNNYSHWTVNVFLQLFRVHEQRLIEKMDPYTGTSKNVNKIFLKIIEFVHCGCRCFLAYHLSMTNIFVDLRANQCAFRLSSAGPRPNVVHVSEYREKRMQLELECLFLFCVCVERGTNSSQN